MKNKGLSAKILFFGVIAFIAVAVVSAALDFKRQAYIYSGVPAGDMTLRYLKYSEGTMTPNRMAGIGTLPSGELVIHTLGGYGYTDYFEREHFTSDGSIITVIDRDTNPNWYNVLPGNTGEILMIQDGNSTPLKWTSPADLAEGTTINDDDVFLFEKAGGGIKKIKASTLKTYINAP